MNNDQHNCKFSPSTPRPLSFTAIDAWDFAVHSGESLTENMLIIAG